jgi:hypothetical protein
MEPVNLLRDYLEAIDACERGGLSAREYNPDARPGTTRPDRLVEHLDACERAVHIILEDYLDCLEVFDAAVILEKTTGVTVEDIYAEWVDTELSLLTFKRRLAALQRAFNYYPEMMRARNA